METDSEQPPAEGGENGTAGKKDEASYKCPQCCAAEGIPYPHPINEGAARFVTAWNTRDEDALSLAKAIASL